ncbi:hypothetical protein Thena_0876 [Thermodesulfobium narugense DSM 14796]|uniref:Uncharacterized protein n=2 Tax=Pseudomonadati TaxID=3379134 RepID=M1E7K1_9BACT|nr:hypothetical protein [Thermodesulfobium narugense]AEE14505.1 hypothetical protein Thena_0876 [Thermodesulfobium narugense DSM 14796]PMP84113.1 MAG: hypothetical protein C0175_00655 [Caldisericum exile]
MYTKDTPVEDVLCSPGAATFFVERGISPFSCSGAFPGTLGSFLEQKQVKDIDAFIQELNSALSDIPKAESI